ncbi:hypothetical protein ABT297_28855 [Dactylosporangium sp. NPDC000555]|uniref:hypothetical protein n=1 Tax=Dactylosporangium sp. NPDC000555 TaxID=3154260 RepID=UPI00332EE18B
MKLSRLILAAAMLAGAAACASPPVAGPPSVSYDPADLVLQVRTARGFVRVEASVTEVPEVSIYGDGRVVVTGPIPEIYPGPALPNLQVRHISAANVRDLTRRALEAGVGNGQDMGMPNVADAPTTYITVRTTAGLATTGVPALGIGSDDDLTAAQRSARKRMQDLVVALGDLPKTLGRGGVDEPATYEPARIAAVAREWTPVADGLPSDPPPIDWPGPAPLPGDVVANRPGVNCLTTDAGPVLAAAKGANARTPWVAGGARWSVQFRPLLPHESSCADLAH